MIFRYLILVSILVLPSAHAILVGPHDGPSLRFRRTDRIDRTAPIEQPGEYGRRLLLQAEDANPGNGPAVVATLEAVAGPFRRAVAGMRHGPHESEFDNAQYLR